MVSHHGCQLPLQGIIDDHYPVAGWISGRIVSLQPDTDIQKLLSNRNRIRIRISQTLFSIFGGVQTLGKVAHCIMIHLVQWCPTCRSRSTGKTRTVPKSTARAVGKYQFFFYSGL